MTATCPADDITPLAETAVPGNVVVKAYEQEPTDARWHVIGYALCAS